MTSLTKAELERLVALSLSSMKHLIRVYGPTVETQHLMGGLTADEAYSFQLIDRILQLPTARKFTSDILGESLDKEPTGNRIKVEENNMATTSTCTALVPAEPSDLMDIQAINAINQLNKSFAAKNPLLEKVAHRQAMASIKATTANMSIDGALSVLNAFGYKNDTVYLAKQKWTACDLGAERYFPDLQGRMANETPIFWFWGGPPTRLKYYAGTLQTLLDDRVMYEIYRRGAAEVAKWIGTDLEGLADVSALATRI